MNQPQVSAEENRTAHHTRSNDPIADRLDSLGDEMEEWLKTIRDYARELRANEQEGKEHGGQSRGSDEQG